MVNYTLQYFSNIEKRIRLQSFLLRRLPKREVLWMIRRVVTRLPFSSWNVSERTYERMFEKNSNLLREDIRHRYGNPIVIWFLINVIVPIIVRLVINWWTKERNLKV